MPWPFCVYNGCFRSQSSREYHIMIPVIQTGNRLSLKGLGHAILGNFV